MNDSQIAINDYELVSIQTINSFKVSISNINLFTNATLNVRLFDSNNNAVSAFPMILSGTDYTNWGGDDMYIYQYVADKMGYTLLTSTPVIPDIDVPVVPV